MDDVDLLLHFTDQVKAQDIAVRGVQVRQIHAVFIQPAQGAVVYLLRTTDQTVSTQRQSL